MENKGNIAAKSGPPNPEPQKFHIGDPVTVTETGERAVVEMVSLRRLCDQPDRYLVSFVEQSGGGKRWLDEDELATRDSSPIALRPVTPAELEEFLRLWELVSVVPAGKSAAYRTGSMCVRRAGDGSYGLNPRAAEVADVLIRRTP